MQLLQLRQAQQAAVYFQSEQQRYLSHAYAHDRTGARARPPAACRPIPVRSCTSSSPSPLGAPPPTLTGKEFSLSLRAYSLDFECTGPKIR